MNEKQIIKESNTISNNQTDRLNAKQKYIKPKLIALGDIRDITMGGSPGFGDSGAGTPEEPF